MTALRTKDWGKIFYRIATVLIVLACLFVLFMGELFSYWLARRHITRHRKAEQLLLADRSLDWMWPKIANAEIIDPKKQPDPKLWNKHNTFWILEQKSTGIQIRLPENFFCQTQSFGPRNFFSVRHCVLRKQQKADHLHELLKQAEIRLDQRACRWEGDICRFGVGWRRVNVEADFRSGGVSRTCIFAHPIRNQWLTLRFPATNFADGIKLFYGFRDRFTGDVPLRLQFKVDQKIILDTQVPHKPRWHVHFWSAKKLHITKADLTIRIWTKDEGSQAFCINATLH